jgi:hypothetical protein
MRTFNRALLGIAVVVGCAGGAPAASVVDDLKIIASDPVTGDEFGSEVSIRGAWSVIGAPRDNVFGANSGSAYLFVKGASGLWHEAQKITPGNPASSANFGAGVAMGDGFCVVGAPVQPTNGMFRSGTAYVFTYDGGQWAQTAELVPANLAANDRLGSSAAVSGDVAVIGAPGDGFFDFVLGKAYVYRRNAQGQWAYETTLFASDAAMNDHFGTSVSIDGDRLVVGADRNDDAGDSSGSAYVFERQQPSGQWVEVARLSAIGAAAGDQFGNAVSISGDVVAVAAFRDDAGGVQNTGSVHLYRRGGGGGGVWSPVTTVTAGNDSTAYDVFGFSIALSGTGLVVGAPTEASPLVSPGRVYVFEEVVGAGWLRTLALDPIDGEAGDFFGDAVAFDGLRAVAGARWDDTTKVNAGSATVYSFVEECVGDLNGDGLRDTADLGVLISEFGLASPKADLNGDGIVDTADLGQLIGVFGQGCP